MVNGNGKEQWKNSDNLTSYEPGQSGNLNGRPKGAKDGIRARLIRQLKKMAPEKVIEKLQEKGIKWTSKTNAGVIAAILVHYAETGNMAAMKMVLDQTEEPLGKDGGDVNVSIDNRTASKVDELRMAFAECEAGPANRIAAEGEE